MSEKPMVERVFEEIYLDSLKKGLSVEASSELARKAVEEA